MHCLRARVHSQNILYNISAQIHASASSLFDETAFFDEVYTDPITVHSSKPAGGISAGNIPETTSYLF